MTRSEYLQILLDDGRLEDAEEIQRLVLEELEEIFNAANTVHQQNEDIARAFCERYSACRPPDKVE